MIMAEPNTNIEYVQRVTKNANRIQKLISNILDMAKIDNLTLKLYKEQFSLPAVISTVIQDFKNQIRLDNKNLDLIYDTTSHSNKESNKYVIVEADKVTDNDSDKLSFDIAQKIQTEMTFPGQIKVTVIREKRAVNIAR